jgi:hypothetical protein
LRSNGTQVNFVKGNGSFVHDLQHEAVVFGGAE